MNLAQMVNRFMQDYGESNFNRFPLDLLKEWFDEAQIKINREVKCIRKTALVDAVNNQRTYAYPADIMAKDIDEVFYGDNSSNSEKIPLFFDSFENLKRADPYFYTRTGTPTHFYHDPHEGKYALYPFESSVMNPTSKIKINYRGKHTKMTRLYSTGTVTLSASTAVTGSGTTFTGNVIAGDQIGSGKLLDVTRATGFPSEFYGIQSVDSATGLTLTSSYAGATGAGISYLSASVSSFSDDELNLACIIYVMGLAYRKDRELQLSEDFMSIAMEKAKDFEYTASLHPDKCTFSTPSGSMTNLIINDYKETRPEYY